MSEISGAVLQVSSLIGNVTGNQSGGSISATTGTFSGTLAVTGSSTFGNGAGNAQVYLSRLAAGNENIIRLKTAGVVKWGVGTGFTADENFHFYNTTLASSVGVFSGTTGGFTVTAAAGTGGADVFSVVNTSLSAAPLLRVLANGKINLSAIPTSSAGLSAGDVWRSGTALNIV